MQTEVLTKNQLMHLKYGYRDEPKMIQLLFIDRYKAHVHRQPKVSVVSDPYHQLALYTIMQ